jgi:hypothetical protein
LRVNNINLPKLDEDLFGVKNMKNMRPKYRYLFLIVLFGLIFLQNPVFAQDNVQKQNNADVSDKLEISFPEVENWNKSEIHTYSTPELGYSVNYRSKEAGYVTVYVYDGGEKQIADGVSDRKIEEQLINAENEIYAFVESGSYDDAQKLKSDIITLGGKSGKVRVLRSIFFIGRKEQKLYSEIYVFGYKNHFIKVRASRPFDVYETENELMLKLFMEIDRLFSE